MSGQGEDALEAGCQNGDESAILEATGLLDSPHPYTRGRACEMLAQMPETRFARWFTERASVGGVRALEWRALALFGESEERLPEGLPAERVLDAMRAAERASADTTFHAIRAAAAVSLPGRHGVAERLLGHSDDEIALRAAMMVAELRQLTDRECFRLRNLRGDDRIHALILLLDNGVEEAGAELVRAVPKSGPFAYHVLDALERSRDELLIPRLRLLYQKKFFLTHLVPRAAGTAAALGDTAALSRLRELSGHRKLTVRSVAWAELARNGDESDLIGLSRLLVDEGAVAPFVLGELWRRDHPLTRTMVHRALEGADPDCRIAALESVLHWLPDPALESKIRDLLGQEVDPAVVKAAETVLNKAASTT